MRNKLYQPYETTKEKGHGTGFGLAIVHNMVVAAGGWIDFTTEADVGTTFRVWLPQVEQRQPVSVDGARLLLIEDEESIREIAILALEAEGYHVTAAPNGLVAIDSHEENLEQFDAVISDIRMPGMDGDRVVERFRKRRKSLPVLFISGHSFRKIEENLDSTCPTLFLQKPFTTMELNHRVRELLELTAE
jgi:CheY-like chemotaxis protein